MTSSVKEHANVAGTQPKSRFSKVMEILLWLAGLGVLAENIVLFHQNRRLNEACPAGKCRIPSPPVYPIYPELRGEPRRAR